MLLGLLTVEPPPRAATGATLGISSSWKYLRPLSGFPEIAVWGQDLNVLLKSIPLCGMDFLWLTILVPVCSFSVWALRRANSTVLCNSCWLSFEEDTSVITFTYVNCSVMSVSLRPMDCSTPGFPVLHRLLELAQIHVHWVGGAIQPSCPLLSPSPPAFNLSQHLSFLMSWLFASGGQNIGTSASASVLPMNIQGWFPLGLTGLISLQSKRLSRVFSSTTVKKHQFFGTQSSLWSSSLIHTWLLERTLVLTRWTFVDKVMSLLFNTVSRFVIAFLPRSKHLLISWLIA